MIIKRKGKIMSSLNISKSKKILIVLIIQLILLFILSMRINYQLFLLGIIADIVVIIAIYLFYNDYYNLILTLIASFTLTYLIENFKMPHSISYIQDYFILIMVSKLIVCFIKRKITMKKIYIPIAIFLVSTVASFLINGGSITSFLSEWFKDYIRYLVIFLALINLDFPENKLIKIMKGLWYLLLLQVPIVFIQDIWSLKHFEVVNPGDIRQDYISGMLGGRGTVELGMLLTIGISTLFVLYLKKRVSLRYFISIFSLFIAVVCISEIKFAFFLIALTFLIIFLINFNLKSAVTLLIAGIIIVVGMQELVKLYPNFKNFLSKEYITSYLKEPYAASGIARSNSFIVANEIITKEFSTTILGYGAGKADKISPTYKFSAFNISQYIVELGYLGIISFYGIFMGMSLISILLIRNGKREFEKILGTIGLIIQVIIVMSTFYNRPMVNITFSIFAWMTNGLIYRYYEFNKKEIYNNNIEICKQG